MKDIEESNEFIKQNMEACYNKFSEELKKEENLFHNKIRIENSSKKNKLIKLYNLADKILEQTKEFLPCQKGCSHCCYINVSITILEAEYIERNTGIKFRKLLTSKSYDNNKFLGITCPFLKNNTCTIYKYRPFACRKHMSFDKDTFWCEIKNFNDKKITMGSFDYEKSYYDITQYSGNTIYGDIRDFFGNKNEE